ncbi:hypothetical protein RM574_04330 [Streptomyces sp. DSM 41982]|uniref:Sugar ABC transporter permease n=1 Tax=Streptomyces evansiae TaxID=3075535 RepID=A0ABD5DZQ9_9ACTN|nr:hypothetical protein [Streptomyces sp. DSM 41982]MDT0414709.1 hypothetical protein [Streptomyces sp. DSM 41982]
MPVAPRGGNHPSLPPRGLPYPLKRTAALLATVPVAVLFFVFQRHFVRGAHAGAVKQ